MGKKYDMGGKKYFSSIFHFLKLCILCIAFPRETLYSLAKVLHSPDKFCVRQKNICVPLQKYSIAHPGEMLYSLAKVSLLIVSRSSEKLCVHSKNICISLKKVLRSLTEVFCSPEKFCAHSPKYCSPEKLCIHLRNFCVPLRNVVFT